MQTEYNREFYTRHASEVARQLIGAVLVREYSGQQLRGRIVETEAYSSGDQASHARPGRTPRNLPMWGVPGYSYVHFTYGMHWLLNVVCEPEGQPAAVLIRAVQPFEDMNHRTDGPARLTRAFGIIGADNGVDMTTRVGKLWIEPGEFVPDAHISTGPRIGLGKRVSEPWLSMPWRWWVTGNPFVSRKG